MNRAQYFFMSAIMSTALRPRSTIGELPAGEHLMHEPLQLLNSLRRSQGLRSSALLLGVHGDTGDSGKLVQGIHKSRKVVWRDI